MTAKSKKLVDLLVLKTGLEKGQVEEQLGRLVESIKSEIDKGEEYKIPELGTFKQKDGKIAFDAEEKLATEINYKYAGMKPIELIGAFKETPEAAVEEENEIAESPATGADSDVEEYSKEPVPEAEEVAASNLSDKDEKEEETEKKDVPVEKIKASEAEPGPSEETTESREPIKTKETTKKEESKTKAEPTPKAYSSKSKQETKDPIGKILVAAVIIVVLGISGWMFYDLGYFDGNSTNNGNNLSESRVAQNFDTAPDELERTGDNKAVTDSVNSGNKSGDNNNSEQDQPNASSSVTDIAEESRQSVYGLRGGAAPRAKDGYTIVVHSLRDEAKVRNLNEELQKDGFRTVISRASIMDTTFWRLGLGQFKTVEDATEATKRLPDPYRNNHFIKRIQ